MDVFSILFINGLIVLSLVVALWLLSIPLQNVSIVDIFWGLGFVLLGWSSLLLAGTQSPRGTVLAWITTLWGVRLAGYLAWRNAGKGEDYRYQTMRQRRPRWFWLWSLPVVFLLQGALLFLVALPLQVTSRSLTSLNWLDAIGLAVWGTGWLFESLGDWQLARFTARAENRGRVMQQGLWRYTRHPNYFGDFLVWWGIYLIALAGREAWWTVISPIVMSTLLIRVSGVAMLESTISRRRPGYAAYARRTSPFFPWPPRDRKP